MHIMRRASRPTNSAGRNFSSTQRSAQTGSSNQRSFNNNETRKSSGGGYRMSSTNSSGNFRNSSSRGRSFPRNGRRFSEKIDVSKFIQRSTVTETAVVYKAQNSFDDFSFNQKLQHNLKIKEYSTPTPIQDQAILPILKGHDLIGLANTGTGKTAAFLLPMIEKVYKNRYEKVLIIAPTRELALQIDNELRAFSNGMSIYSAACVGGAPIGKQIFSLKRNPNFVIGTPGRLKDLSDRRLIRFESFQNIILDEVDRMLDMGFVEEITAVLNQMPASRQSLFFSATMPIKIRTLVKQFLKDPVVVEIKSGDTSKNVMQDVVRVNHSENKFDKLQNILSSSEMKKVLIFSETKHEVEKLAVSLSNNGLRAESIHGDKRQSQRQRALSAFKNDNVKILVATDVAARGLDINDISHVINYTIPQTYNDYIHRIGRTGRGNKSGVALTFIES